MFLLPVEEKAISGFSGNARDGLFPLPVEEKALSGPRREAQERPFSDDSGRQLWPLTIAVSPSETRKRQIAGRFCLFAMVSSLYLSRKMQLQSSSGPNSTYLQTTGLGEGWNPN